MSVVDIKWTVLIIAAFTDVVITSLTGLTTAMLVMGEIVMPSSAVILFSVLMGLLSGTRTMQQGLKTAIA